MAINGEYAEKWPMITAKTDAPADWEQWKNVEGKKYLFSPNPAS